MAILSTDIKQYLSGGASNTDANASLGGIINATTGEITSGNLNNLFDDVTGDESAAGDTEYRCFYVKNTHGSLTWQASKVWISSNTPSTDTEITIGLGTSAVNATEQTVANESTAPAGVTFSTAVNEAASLSIGDVPFGQTMAVWVKRVVSAAASAYNNDTVTLNFKGDTGA